MTARFLCDTNVLSELLRQQPNPGVVTWARALSALTLSAITIEEMSFGLAWKPNPRLQTWFTYVTTTLCEVLPVTQDIARRSGELRGRLRSRGRTRSQSDMLIAATAHVHQMTLVTRNNRDFEDCGISVLDPFA